MTDKALKHEMKQRTLQKQSQEGPPQEQPKRKTKTKYTFLMKSKPKPTTKQKKTKDEPPPPAVKLFSTDVSNVIENLANKTKRSTVRNTCDRKTD